jgi:hypothetical protein
MLFLHEHENVGEKLHNQNNHFCAVLISLSFTIHLSWRGMIIIRKHNDCFESSFLSAYENGNFQPEIVISC